MADSKGSLKQLSLCIEYDSDENEDDPLHILNNFYIPCLSNATTYHRLAGFFSSSTFSVISEGLMHFILNNGKMKLITSPHLSSKDCEAITNGTKTESEIINESLIRELFSKEGSLDDNSELLGWMIAHDKLELRLAVMYNSNGDLLDAEEIDKKSMFHHKIGVFIDDNGNVVSFMGSINETFTAWIKNGESFDVFCNWEPGQDRYTIKHQQRFNRYWEYGKHGRVNTVSLPEAVKKQWVKDIPDSIEDLSVYKKYMESQPNGRDNGNGIIEDREYQREAVEAWVSNNYCGLFDMATGTGKTKTALLAAKRLVRDKNNKIAVVIVCPYLHLTQMWEEEVTNFGFNNYVMGHSQSPDWKDHFERKVRLFKVDQECFVFITTINTFCTKEVQMWINKIATNTLLIVDEVHRMGSKTYSTYLNKQIPYRLGVSATIDRYKDAAGTDRLLNYFGPRCITYTLEKALKDGRLTPYKYHPIICYFTDREYSRIIEINREINELLEENPPNNMKKIEELKVNGYRLIAKMDDKLGKLVSAMNPHKDDYHMLVYCGATSITSLESEIDAETGNSEESERLIMYLSKKLYEEYGLKLRTFTCSDNIENRKTIIEDFTKKHIQSILAIRCLDEGVDIPDIKYAFILSSSEDPKEYIQRRGRVLRKTENKQYAEIFDFLAFPRSYESGTISTNNEKIELGIILKELKRVYEFSRLSMNPEESKTIFDRVSLMYGVDNIWEELNG